MKRDFRDFYLLAGWYVLMAITPASIGPLLFLSLAIASTLLKPGIVYRLFTLQFLLLHANLGIFGEVLSGGAHCLLPFFVLIRFLSSAEFGKMLAQHVRFQIFPLCLLGLLIHSLVFSLYPDVSISKIILFGSYSLAVLVAIFKALNCNRRLVLDWFVNVVVFCCWASLPILWTPYALYRNSTGFTGVFVHPQVLGQVLGIGIAYLIVKAVLARRAHGLLLLTIAVGLFEVYRSECRGGLLSCVFAVSVALGFEFTQAKAVDSRRLQTRIVLGAVVSFALMILSFDKIIDTYEHFVSKSGRAGTVSLGESFYKSRGHAVEQDFNAWRQRPLGGIGFQVSASPNFASGIVYDPISGSIPISASVEKGFIYTAILVEGGLIGSCLMYGIMAVVVWPLFRPEKFPERVFIAGVFLSNVSEATFFSTTGMGAWFWQLLAVAQFSSSRFNKNNKSQGGNAGKSPRHIP